MRPDQKVPDPESLAGSLNLSFRPGSYWGESSLSQALFGNIQGEARRRLILNGMGADNPESMPNGLLEPVLDPGLRTVLGRIHPMFMGGEYLPPYLPGEVEIARICLASVTADVISVRARPESDLSIHYRVVDEYETKYQLPFETSVSPLTLQELIALMKESSNATESDIGLVLGPLAYNLEGDGGGSPDDYENFVTVRSDFYPGLEAHFETICQGYLNGLKNRHQDEDCDEN